MRLIVRNYCNRRKILLACGPGTALAQAVLINRAERLKAAFSAATKSKSTVSARDLIAELSKRMAEMATRSPSVASNLGDFTVPLKFTLKAHIAKERCGCQGKCDTNRCDCRKHGRLCTSRCHHKPSCMKDGKVTCVCSPAVHSSCTRTCSSN
jgi:hypothetical protein